MEFSEARYAEIARKILAENDWITLWFYTDEPFWGKPPMSFWSIAVSYQLFGVNEFSARLPSLLFTLANALIILFWSRRRSGSDDALLASVVFLSCWLVLQSSGAVLTDPLLVLAITLVMISFWEACHTGGRLWAYLFWIALAIGLLAKGPVALVLCALACGLWVAIFNQWRNFFTNIRLVSGVILMLSLTVPWYYLAEAKTPGFLNYFLVGEHFERYTQSEWQGDPYGAVKERPVGTIWIYFLVATLPWSLLVIPGLFNRKRLAGIAAKLKGEATLPGYLLLWLIVPLVFFTPAQNVLITYALPSIPAFSLLFARSLREQKNLFTFAIATMCAFFAVTLGSYWMYFEDHRYNQKPMIEKYQELNSIDPGDLVYTGTRIFSPQFYTGGKVLFENDRDSYVKHNGTFYFAVRERWMDSYEDIFSGRCFIEMQRVDFSLFYCPATD